MPRTPKPASPFRRFNSSPEVIRMAVMLYVRYPPSLRNVEDLLFKYGHEYFADNTELSGGLAEFCVLQRGTAFFLIISVMTSLRWRPLNRVRIESTSIFVYSYPLLGNGSMIVLPSCATRS